MSDEEDAPRKRPGGRSARIGDAVLAATLEVLSEDGFGALTVERVAERAGIHKTTVYRRWGSRESLVGEALAKQGSEAIALPDTGTLRGDLRLVAAAVAANLATPLGRALAQAMVGQGDDPEIAQVTEDFWSTRFERTAVLVERAIDRGELPPASDARLTVELVVASVWFRSIVTRSKVDDELIETVVDAILEGLLAA